MESEEIQLTYPGWAKALGIVGIPLLAAVGIWMSLRPLLEEDLTVIQQVFFPVIGIAVIYQCYIGAKCYGSFNTVVTLNDYGINVNRKGEIKNYSWGSLLVEYYSFATTIHISHKSGESVGYFSEGLENLGLLVSSIENEKT